MSGVKNLVMAENKGVKPITNEELREDGVKGKEVKESGELN